MHNNYETICAIIRIKIKKHLSINTQNKKNEKNNLSSIIHCCCRCCNTQFASCKKDNDDVKPVNVITPDINGVNEADNYFIIDGGPFNNYKFQYSDSSVLTATRYTNDSSYLFMKKSAMENALMQLHGSSNGTYNWSTQTQFAMLFQRNGSYYAIECNSPSHTGNVTITSFGNVGGKVTGTMTANTTVIESPGGNSYPVSITGKFELKRTY